MGNRQPLGRVLLEAPDIYCAHCGWPMGLENVPPEPDTTGVIGTRPDCYQRARCANCGHVVEPDMPTEHP